MKVGKITRAEVALLVLTGGFLCLLLGLWHQDRTAPGVTVETAVEIPVEEIQPDLTPLNINTATAEALAELPGIGPELAARIVEYREANGPFAAAEALMEVRGIGEGKLAELEGRITVSSGRPAENLEQEEPGGSGVKE